MIGKKSIKHNYVSKKEYFYSNRKMEDITDGITDAKRVCKDFEIKKLGENIMIYMFKAIHYYWQIFL